MMKKLRIIPVLIVIVSLACFACNNKNNPGRGSDIVFEKLAGSWTLGTEGSIVLDGEDISLNYPGFTLSFADGTYQTTNGGDLFRATGTWEWADEAGRVLTLDTGEDVDIIQLTPNEFEFSFFHVGSTRAGIRGDYRVNVFK